MIFVTVGTHYKGFDRLVSGMDEIAGRIDEPVTMQIGATAYFPRNATAFRAAPYEQMLDLISDARVVLSHAGSGSILDCLACGKVPIVMPRRREFGEAIDDHQVEMAEELARSGKVRVANDVQDLERMLGGPPTPAWTGHTPSRLVMAVAAYISKLDTPA